MDTENVGNSVAAHMDDVWKGSSVMLPWKAKPGWASHQWQVDYRWGEAKMWLRQQDLGGKSEKDSDRGKNHKVTSKRPSPLSSPSWLETSPPLLSHFLHVLLIDCPPSTSNHEEKPEDHSNCNPCSSWSHVPPRTDLSQLQSWFLLD